MPSAECAGRDPLSIKKRTVCPGKSAENGSETLWRVTRFWEWLKDQLVSLEDMHRLAKRKQ